MRASTQPPFMGTVYTVQEEPIDPFSGDPADPAAGLDDLTEDAEQDPLTEAERQDVLEDLSDLEIYQALLSPTGIRGLVIECEDCHEPHYFDWDLLRGNLRICCPAGGRECTSRRTTRTPITTSRGSMPAVMQMAYTTR